METIEALRLIARGFERERVTDRQAKSAVPTILAAIAEIELLAEQLAAAIQNREIAESLRKEAERYRYLRNRKPAEVMGRGKAAAGCWIDCEDANGNLALLTGDDADTAIAAAMAAGSATRLTEETGD